MKISISKINKDKIKYIIFIVFFICWTHIWFRNFYKDFLSHLEETKSLCGKSLEQKWEYVFGANLYKFLSASKEIVPMQEKIFFVHNLDRFRYVIALYFLYPRLNSEDGNFILVYKQPFDKKENSKVLYAQDQDIFIIRK